MNSKQKVGRGEREFSALCHDEGYNNVHRGKQFQGGVDSPDVKGLSGINVEVKRVERLNIHDAMAQSIKDSGSKAIPIVAHRRNKGKRFITMSAKDWFALYRKWEVGQ